ncbi:heavy-metal-associated domain-containing protein [Psychrilyobacter atlanticus]|uniref:heavy-metal-associated domain-containing protein n=1 Tax=Psychrilyobacter atlanticus TaxID=271091 RepID=UPI00041B255E|nr:heavy metal-associated domain-containing protein [Psychrilyobacter atlanticus]
MKKILIEGMMCSQCVTIVENKLKNLEGIREVEVVLETDEVFIGGDISDDVLKMVIESEGYKIIDIKKMNQVRSKTINTSAKKGFFSKLIDKIGNSNENTFGEGHLDCCDLNKKDK